MRRLLWGVAAGWLAVLALCASASAQLPLPVPLPTLPVVGGGGPAPQPYGANDGGGFRNILPPGENGFDNAAQLAAFEATKARPPHNDDQLGMYSNLIYAAPGLTEAQIPSYFKDATFGVQPNDVESTESPRSDVTIERDKGFGVPHVYGATRAGTMFGLGYATAEDRLFFIDILRHLGRAELTSFAGGAPGNQAFDQQQWATAPYTEADLTKQVNQFTQLYGADGDQVEQDVLNYIAGINQYIAEARINPLKMPGEYDAINQPQGPTDFKPEDLIAIASLVGGIFGNGGGNELASAQVYEAALKRFGRKRGPKVWSDFRSANDPEAPTTVHTGKRFPYDRYAKKTARGSRALPDPGTLKTTLGQGISHSSSAASQASTSRSGLASGLQGLFAFPHANSNALVVSAAHSVSGHPLAVFGPQVAYFAPEILMEEDVHGPGIDARGAAFPGVNLYVELGHGRDYAWSATSAGSDISDTWALPLCEPNGAKPTVNSNYYLYKGACRQMETLTRHNSWTPNLADSTPAGSETLTAQRTALGLVAGRATIKGKPVAYVKDRTTYFHEVDSALGFKDINDPNKVTGPHDFQVAMSKVGYTFNWFYVDNKHTAYFNSGNDPVRPRGPNYDLPVWGRKKWLWKGFNDQLNTARYLAFSKHPQVIDQDWMTSWNNKQAPGFHAADNQWGYGPVYRSQMLDESLKPQVAHGKKTTLAGVINAMENAGTVDMRADRLLPLAFKLLGKPRNATAAHALAELKAWHASGSHRIDRNRDGSYDNADAVRIMDAWWPLWLKGEFEPVLGSNLFGKLENIISLDNPPNNEGQHLGSAYQDGWWGYVSKDLRRLLGRRERGRYSRIYCGAGHSGRQSRKRMLRGCRSQLLNSLIKAARTPASSLYKDDVCSAQGQPDSQTCFDKVYFRPLGAVTQPLIPWINRPTFQQVVEVQNHR
ncbi:MAG TPA: penicillin acylase family protein [Thermoleophilaceae bacterium]